MIIFIELFQHFQMFFFWTQSLCPPNSCMHAYFPVSFHIYIIFVNFFFTVAAGSACSSKRLRGEQPDDHDDQHDPAEPVSHLNLQNPGPTGEEVSVSVDVHCPQQVHNT